MLHEFTITNWDKTIQKRVYCSTRKKAFEKAKFIFPKTWSSIHEIKKTRTFKNFDDFLENR